MRGGAKRNESSGDLFGWTDVAAGELPERILEKDLLVACSWFILRGLKCDIREQNHDIAGRDQLDRPVSTGGHGGLI